VRIRPRKLAPSDAVVRDARHRRPQIGEGGKRSRDRSRAVPAAPPTTGERTPACGRWRRPTGIRRDRPRRAGGRRTKRREDLGRKVSSSSIARHTRPGRSGARTWRRNRRGFVKTKSSFPPRMRPIVRSIPSRFDTCGPARKPRPGRCPRSSRYRGPSSGGEEPVEKGRAGREDRVVPAAVRPLEVPGDAEERPGDDLPHPVGSRGSPLPSRTTCRGRRWDDLLVRGNLEDRSHPTCRRSVSGREVLGSEPLDDLGP